jgi:antitoxin component of MazEF toxin-antitoxin module
MTLSYVKKVKKVGNAIMVLIPSEIIEAGDIHVGDYVQVTVKRLITYSFKGKDMGKLILKDKLRSSVLEALIMIYPVELERIQTTDKYIKKGGENEWEINTINHIDEYWTTTSTIREMIISKSLGDIENNKNIYSDIGDVLIKLGFTKTQRTKLGIQRLINVTKLEEITGQKIRSDGV